MHRDVSAPPWGHLEIVAARREIEDFEFAEVVGLLLSGGAEPPSPGFIGVARDNHASARDGSAVFILHVAAEHAERNQFYDNAGDVLLFGNLEGRGSSIAALRVHVAVALRADHVEARFDAVEMKSAACVALDSEVMSRAPWARLAIQPDGSFPDGLTRGEVDHCAFDASGFGRGRLCAQQEG